MIVDDDELLCSLMKEVLLKEGYSIDIQVDGEACLEALSLTVPDTICLDLSLPGMHGLETLERITGHYPLLPVIILTADDKAESAVNAMQKGAYDYLLKPIDWMKLKTTIKNAVEKGAMSMKLHRLEREVQDRGYPGIIGRSQAMLEIYRQMDRISMSDISVLIQGESGTGKEVIARALHESSGRRKGPFIALNCAAIPANLLESELFGHEKGAFTGAVRRHTGKFEQAHGGTIFLDEITELDTAMQAKLLRVIQERKLNRVGGVAEVEVDIRLITAAQKNLRKEVKDGHFREDLYYRTAVFEMFLPPLRKRREDIPLLAEKFLDDYSKEHGMESVMLSPEALNLLLSHTWPGNVRELQNAIQRAVIVAIGGVIRPEDLPIYVQRRDTLSDRVKTTPPFLSSRSIKTEDIERRAIADAIEKTGGNMAEAARLLGIGRTTLYRKLKKYRLR